MPRLCCHAPVLHEKGVLRRVIEIIKRTVAGGMEDDVPRLAAAVAFYAVLSLAPLLVLSLRVVQLFFGEAAARGELASAMHAFADERTASALEAIIANAASSEGETAATFLGIAVAIAGASGVFYQLKRAMNAVWDVPTKRSGWRLFIKQRLWAIVFAAVAIMLVLATALATSVLSYVQQVMPEARWGDAMLWRGIGFLFTTLLYSLLFAAIFRYLPDMELRWRHVLKGAVITAFVAAVGQHLIGLYAARSLAGSAYGAAGSLAIVLIWVFGASLILFFGAELTEVLAHSDREVADERRRAQEEEGEPSDERD